jgi:hypothetical protein
MQKHARVSTKQKTSSIEERLIKTVVDDRDSTIQERSPIESRALETLDQHIG